MTLDPNSTLLAIAVLNVITAFLAYRTHKLTKEVEKQTNSMKDALVASTREASFAAGHDKGRLEGEATAATLAKGKLEQ